MYRLIQDDSSHWYVIEVAQEALFQTWVNWCCGLVADYAGPDFNSKRINGPESITFDSVAVRHYGGGLPIRDDRRTWEDTADDEE